MAKLTPSELLKIESIDTKIENLDLKRQLKKKDIDEIVYKQKILQMNSQINELEKRLKQHDMSSTEKAEDDAKQERRELLKSLATKHKVKAEVWGYDPLTGEIIENNNENGD